ncbi:MAG: alpha-mannosidase [Clostridiales bacterium]|nr:alpha-mannosidase [Clostridiales bacterium]
MANKFLTLKTAVGGNREQMHYEDTFGMPREEFFHVTRPGKWNTRILSELEFLLNLPSIEGQEAIIDQALDLLLEHIQGDGVLSNEVCRRAEEILMPLQQEAKSYEVILAAHAHLDMNWMWSYPETVAATLATFRTMLSLMDEYPDFHFSQSQAAVYHIVEQYDPDMMAEIQRRIHEGRWECTATAWVEADHNMPNTESLLRQISMTRDYLSTTWGVSDFEIDFSPDTFGHTLSLPEIDGFSGIKYFYHCRGLKDDEILYRYRAPSGRELLTYREPFWYNAAITPRMGIAAPIIAQRCGGLKTGLGLYGVGDHGGGPTRRDIEFALEMMAWPLFPVLRFGTLRSFFHAAEAVRDSLPIIAHEVNFFAPGCYTTQSRIKRGNRLLEAQLYDAETLGVLAGQLAGFRLKQHNMNAAWQNVLFTHFHDIITGSCVQDTREHAMGLYQHSAAFAQSETSLAIQAICKHIDTTHSVDAGMDPRSQSEGAGGGYHVGHFGGFPCPERGSGKKRIFHLFNTLQEARTEVVELTSWDWVGDLRRASAVDAAGSPLPMQLVDSELQTYWDHKYFRFLVQVEVPAMGYTTVVLREKELERYPLYFQSGERISASFDDLVLDNGILRVTLDRGTGRIASIIKDGHELIREDAGFSLVETEAATSNAWQISRHIRELPVNQCEDLRIMAQGALRQSVQVKYRVASSIMTAIYHLDKDSQMLRVETTVDWHEVGGSTVPLLIFRAPLSYKPEHFRYDTAAGSILRGSIANDVPALQYGLAAKQDGEGLLLVSDCKYGFRGRENSLSISLINSATSPDPYPERGIHRFVLGLGACSDQAQMAGMMATRFNHSILYQSNSVHGGSLPPDNSLLALEADGIMLSAVIPQAGGVLRIRMYELNGMNSQGVLYFSSEILQATTQDALGNAVDSHISVAGQQVEFTVKPYQLIELHVVLEPVPTNTASANIAE